ncbi:MAG: biopolymer transporter ExbD [Planctomycetaceae bacterium]
MQIRNKLASGKIEMQMSAMIDIVFQLLIFFMLTLKIIPEEGDFTMNMPLCVCHFAPDVDYTVRLVADADGNLQQIMVGDQSLGNDEAAFSRLNSEVKNYAKSGGQFNDDIAVTLDVDYELNYKYIIKAVANCTSSREGDRTVKFLESVKFAPPREPRTT